MIKYLHTLTFSLFYTRGWEVISLCHVTMNQLGVGNGPMEPNLRTQIGPQVSLEALFPDALSGIPFLMVCLKEHLGIE